jgi:hypothetical protein
MDPLAEKYYCVSPYSYALNNPLKYIDPTGKDVLIWYKNPQGAMNSFRYQGGRVSHPNAYVNQVIRAINYNISNGAGNPSREATFNRKFTVNVYEVDIDSKYSTGTKTVYWNSTLGRRNNNGTVVSPATVLDHEFDHAVRHIKDKAGHDQDAATTDKNYTNMEEKRVITGSEQETARANGEIKKGQVTRTGHNGNYVVTESETSTEVDEEKTKPTLQRIDEYRSSWNSEYSE